MSFRATREIPTRASNLGVGCFDFEPHSLARIWFYAQHDNVGPRALSHFGKFQPAALTCSRMDIVLHPIGRVHSSERSSREDFWGEIVSEIRLDERKFIPDALQGLAEFSHVEVLFYLHGVSDAAVVSGLRHPRNNPKWPQVGIFAQRGKARPNRIAATVCRLLSVQGLTVRVQGLDAFDGSPVLDIKPVFAEFTPERAAIRQPAWAREMMAEYFGSGERR